MQKAIEVTNLCKRYSQEVLKNFSLSVNEGEMVVLLGESGCGKSTFIRILAGLENADSGSVCLNGISTDERIPPNKRNIALVYQEPVLWNHMPVWKNIAYGMAKKDKKVIYELMDALDQNYKDRKTILYVTHSKMEADFLGCRQIRMDVKE